MSRTNVYVLGFGEINKTMLSMVGGKGANLGELCRIEGISVPAGFCVTTEAYQEIIGNNDALDALLDQLFVLKADDRKGISDISAKIRKLIEETAIPESLVHDPENTYVIKAKGIGLQEEFILEGDLLIIEARQEAMPGETIIALIKQKILFRGNLFRFRWYEDLIA